MLGWKRFQDQYISGLETYQGKYPIFRIFYDASSSKSDEKKYKLSCKLFGMKSDFGKFIDEDSAKIQAEQVYRIWLANTELQEIPK